MKSRLLSNLICGFGGLTRTGSTIVCGIFGYTGKREAPGIVLEALRRLEYRGYDSAGLATLAGASLQVRKRAGRIDELARMLAEQPASGVCGIGHTRWATHGGVSDANAHPHVGGDGLVAVVHNGVMENYAALKRQLLARGVTFHSQTDTEVLAQMIALAYRGDLVEAVCQALEGVRGTYGLAVISPRHPGLIVGARLGSPLAVGVGHGENFLTSDPAALVGHTDQVVFLADHQLCTLTPDRWEILDAVRTPIVPHVQTIDWIASDASKNDYAHYMLKEIYEQPEALENAMRGRLDDDGATAKFGGSHLDPASLLQVQRIVMIACGTSYYAALAGEYLVEELAGIPVEVDFASEFRYRHAPLDRSTVVLALTQSGETADTLAALREAKRRGCPTLALCNVVGSAIAREADGGIFLHAGPEIGVASTKTFTSQLAALTLLALALGRLRHLSPLQGAQILRDLRALPDLARQTLACHSSMRRLAARFVACDHFLYLGRQFLFPIALEGALKLKEISYIHADAYPAGEMKHGPIALIDAHTPTVILVPRGAVRDKVLSNLEEVKSRGGPVLAIGNPDDEDLAAVADNLVPVPAAPDYLQPVLYTIPLQLLAYELALLRGCDIDKPRNLAKSVTVE